jgi:hypothetical protein
MKRKVVRPGKKFWEMVQRIEGDGTKVPSCLAEVPRELRESPVVHDPCPAPMHDDLATRGWR